MSEQASVSSLPSKASLVEPVASIVAASVVAAAAAGPSATAGIAGATAAAAASADDAGHDIAARLAVAVGRLHRRIRPNHDGLSHGLISALGTIVRVGEIRPGDLARIESVAAPTMTRIIADLEGKGLVVRRPDPADGRSFFVTATDAGIEAISRARFERAERVARLLEELPDDQIAALEAAIEALEAAADSGSAPLGAPRTGRS